MPDCSSITVSIVTHVIFCYYLPAPQHNLKVIIWDLFVSLSHRRKINFGAIYWQSQQHIRDLLKTAEFLFLAAEFSMEHMQGIGLYKKSIQYKHRAVILNLYKYVIYELGESAGARRDCQRQICLLIQVIIKHTAHNALPVKKTFCTNVY